MRSRELLDALFAPSFERGQVEARTVLLYLRRLFALRRPQIYAYFYERDQQVMSCLPQPREQAEFILAAWDQAPIEHWEHWAAAMPRGSEMREGELGSALAPRVSRLVAQMLEQSAQLEPAATRSVIAHLDPLRPALVSLAAGEEVEAVVTAAKAALDTREWWLSADAAEQQCALHDLLRAVEVAAPGVAVALQGLRATDVHRAPLDEPEAVRGMVTLAANLPSEAYNELIEALPSPDNEVQPVLYAEVVAATAVLQQRNPRLRGSFYLVRQNLRELKNLRAMGNEYWPQRRRAGVACLDLSPSPGQIEVLRVHLGANPGEEAMAALNRWARQNNRKRVAAALSRLIRPDLDPTTWAAALSEGDYLEAPVIRTLAEKLGKEKKTTVSQRRRMAKIVGALQIRTQSGRDAVADLIAELLKKDRPKSDLSVALVLAAGLGPEHRCHSKLEKAFIAYARRTSHKFTPDEYRSIVKLGIVLDQKFLSKKAEKTRKEIVEEAIKGGVKQLAGKLSGVG